MTSSRRFSVPFTCSVVMHVALALLLAYAARDNIISAPAPVAVELWSAAPSAPTPTEVAKPVAIVTPAAEVPTPSIEQPKADVQLGHKPVRPKTEASVPTKVIAKATPKPQVRKPVEVPAVPAVDSKLAAAKASKVAKAKKSAKQYSDDTNDLLSDLNSSNTTRPANARADRAGAANGVAGGSLNGSAQARDNYAAKIQSRVRPLVQLPPDLKGNPKAVVQVQLWPTLEVRAVKLLQSSGNPAYDEAVQRAIWEAKTFPALPSGMGFGEVRQLKLEFRPR
jgi:colicin import membrane protein